MYTYCIHTHGIIRTCVIGVFQTVLPSPETYCSVIMDMTYMWFTRYHDVQILKCWMYTYTHVPVDDTQTVAIKTINVYIYCAFRVVWKGFRRRLVFEDLTDIMDQHKSDRLLPRFSLNWQQELERCRRRQRRYEETNMHSEQCMTIQNSDCGTSMCDGHGWVAQLRDRWSG